MNWVALIGSFIITSVIVFLLYLLTKNSQLDGRNIVNHVDINVPNLHPIRLDQFIDNNNDEELEEEE